VCQLRWHKNRRFACEAGNAGGQKEKGSGGNEFLPVRAEIVTRKRFELRSAIATNLFRLQ